MQLKLVTAGNSILSQKCKPYNWEDPIMDAQTLTEELHRLRREDGGVGLAAPQGGINTRVLVTGIGNFETEGVRNYDYVFFNPEIIEYSEDQVWFTEGCLSFPNLYIKIKRPENIVISWENEQKEKNVEKFGGILGRILQHEVDHLDGVTFDHRARWNDLQKARKVRTQSERRKRRIQNA